MCNYAAYHKIDAEAVNISLLTVYMAEGYKASVESPVFVRSGGRCFEDDPVELLGWYQNLRCSFILINA